MFLTTNLRKGEQGMSTKDRPALTGSYMGSIADLVRQVVMVALERFGAEEGWSGRVGGCFCLGNGITGDPLCIFFLGADSLKQFEVYETSVKQNMEYLKEHPGHDAPEGTIMAERVMFSLRGLPELGNEVAVLVAAVLTHELSVRGAEIIARKSKNPYFEPLCQAMERKGYCLYPERLINNP